MMLYELHIASAETHVMQNIHFTCDRKDGMSIISPSFHPSTLSPIVKYLQLHPNTSSQLSPFFPPIYFIR